MSAELKLVAWLTTDEEGSPAMLFFDREEAGNYCEIGEEPEALVRLSDLQAKEAEIAALKEDAERYLWLRDKSEWEMFEDRWLTTHDIYGQGPNDMDAAIDAAREKNHG